MKHCSGLVGCETNSMARNFNFFNNSNSRKEDSKMPLTNTNSTIDDAFLEYLAILEEYAQLQVHVDV